jgi:hypothetical protein
MRLAPRATPLGGALGGAAALEEVHVRGAELGAELSADDVVALAAALPPALTRIDLSATAGGAGGLTALAAALAVSTAPSLCPLFLCGAGVRRLP